MKRLRLALVAMLALGASGSLSACQARLDVDAASGPKCGASPAVLVDFHGLATQLQSSTIAATPLAVDDVNVYFVFANTLMCVPVRGGPVITMLSLPVPANFILNPVSVVVTSTSVILHYPQNGGPDERIVSVPIGGSGSTSLATSDGTISAFGGDEGAVYFIDASGTHSVPTTGGAVQLLTDQLTSAAAGGFGGSLGVVGSNLVATTAALGGSIVAVPLAGGTPTTFASQQPNASFPMACDTDLCWWAGPTPAGVAGTGGPGAIVRADAGGNLSSLSGAPYFPWSLSFDGTYFYETVGCDLCDGSFLRLPVGGGPSTSMGTATFAAVDDECAYASTSAGITSVSKTYAAGP
jgi:hypothetical protein